MRGDYGDSLLNTQNLIGDYGDSLLNTQNLIAALYELQWNYNAWQSGHIEEYVLFSAFSKLSP